MAGRPRSVMQHCCCVLVYVVGYIERVYYRDSIVTQTPIDYSLYRLCMAVLSWPGLLHACRIGSLTLNVLCRH